MDFPEPENEKRQYNISDKDKMVFMKAKEEKMAAMSVNDYQLTAKVLTVLRVHIPTLKSVQLRLWG